MKRLLTIAFAFLLTHQVAQAAEIAVVSEETADHPALILVKGQFMKNQQGLDLGLFSELVENLKGKTALVFLDSPGGQLLTGLGIGRIIHEHGLSTVVADGVQCSSACALAWVAGKERFMGATARVGFHAISHENGEVSSEGNASVGAYLYEIGITQPNAITYLTMAPPNSMKWMSKSLGHAFKITIQQPIPFADAPWAKPASLSWLPRDKSAAKTEAKTETVATTIGVTGHVIRIPLKGSPLDTVPTIPPVIKIVTVPVTVPTSPPPGVAITEPTSLPDAKPIVPPVPVPRFRRFDDADSAQK